MQLSLALASIVYPYAKLVVCEQPIECIYFFEVTYRVGEERHRELPTCGGYIWMARRPTVSTAGVGDRVAPLSPSLNNF